MSYLPDAPTFAEAGHDLVAEVWFGLLAPKGVPEDVLNTLRETTHGIAKEDATIERFERLNFVPAVLDHEAFQARINANIERHRQILTDIGMMDQ